MGDGVFDTVRTYGSIPFLLDRHLARLREGGKAIGLAPLPSLDGLRRACRATFDDVRAGAPSSGEWTIRPMLYSTETGAALSVLVDPLPRASFPPGERKISAGIASYLHPGAQFVPPGARRPAKWISRGPLAHALREARIRGWEEAVLGDEEGRLIEGTRSNLLAVIGGRLVSPGSESLALAGVTREVALEGARTLGIPVDEYAPTRVELRTATEILLSSTLLEVASVQRVAGLGPRPARGKTPVGTALRRYYHERVRADCRVP